VGDHVKDVAGESNNIMNALYI